MLPYKNRLIKRKDFEGVHRQGKFFYFGNIAVKVRKNGMRESRIGFSVGINYSKKAAERNKIKRQLRNIFHEYLEKIEKGFDIIVIAKKEEKKNSGWKNLNLNVESALKKAKLINNNRNK
jgi:ribonuclease P protein component